MPNICIVTSVGKNGKWASLGARDLYNALKKLGAEVVRSESSVAGYFNVGWGKSGSNLNKKLPSSKLWELQTLAKAGVPVVPFSTNFDEAKKLAVSWRKGLILPIFGRKLKHTRGLDIVKYEPTPSGYVVPARRTVSDFYTVALPKTAEYRVHVFGGKAVRSGTKMKENGTTHDAQPIWNLDHGFQIRYENPAPGSAKEVAKAAVKAAGVDFAAVDVIQTGGGLWPLRFWVLELNCAPGLHGNTVAKYADHILKAATA